VPAPRPLYRLSELLANPTAPVIVCEGEKKADAVPRLFPGYIGTISMGGANAAGKSDWSPLTGRHVIIWPDNDEPGRRYAEDVAGLATAAGAASVAIVGVPADWPEGWDLADPLPDGETSKTLARLLAEAALWTPAAADPGARTPRPRTCGRMTTPRLPGSPSCRCWRTAASGRPRRLGSAVPAQSSIKPLLPSAAMAALHPVGAGRSNSLKSSRGPSR
jgi:hypothetical protein